MYTHTERERERERTHTQTIIKEQNITYSATLILPSFLQGLAQISSKVALKVGSPNSI